ncbi:hypothetical protein [Nocardioides terrisoli]|uniref:hypothetical protein n=1 Tax=Nocardioides terrisoli TaxID=3388267 RepID=UPI00287B722F|nr:hypothetical protein [Nocardioides marmorisolisilvae]
MAERVFLHVGTPKTGTSAFQHALFTHRDHLAEQGVLYPAERFDAHFLAALDLMQLPWGGLEREAAGAWERLAAEVRQWPGTAMVSHEILGRASRQQVARALESLGDAEVHVILSARDLARQLPAEWQENIKHRRTIHYADFLAAVRDESRSMEIVQWFWSVQELPDVLARWGDTLAPEQVHVITVPPYGAPHDVLGRRFAAAFGIDVGMLATRDRANASLGVAESALVRQLNERLELVLPNHHYRQFVREGLVHQNLGTHRESARLTLPPPMHAWAAERSREWVEELARKGYDVVGALEDLLPDEVAPDFVDPDAADPGQVVQAALRALSASVQESARLRDVEVHLHADIADLMRQLDEAHSTRLYRAKERFVAAADRSVLARAGLGAYRRLRGRNSRST